MTNNTKIRSEVQDGTRRANDRARSENPPDLFADSAISAAAFTIARRVADAADGCAKHAEASCLRSRRVGETLVRATISDGDLCRVCGAHRIRSRRSADDH